MITSRGSVCHPEVPGKRGPPFLPPYFRVVTRFVCRKAVSRLLTGTDMKQEALERSGSSGWLICGADGKSLVRCIRDGHLCRAP